MAPGSTCTATAGCSSPPIETWPTPLTVDKDCAKTVFA